MPAQFGIHAANIAPYHDEELIRTGAGCTTIVIDGGAACDRVAWLRSKRTPAELTIILRPWFVSDFVHGLAPEAQADACFRQVEGLLGHTTHVTLGNEFNVETPGFDQRDPAHWRRLADYKLALYRRFRELAPRCDLHLSAESWGCGDDETVTGGPALALQRPVAALCDYVDAHAYWYPGKPCQDDGGLRFLRVRGLFPDTPMYLTECGPLDVRDQPRAWAEIEAWDARVRSLPWLCGYSLFSMNWGDGHPELSYHDKPSLLQRLADMPKERPRSARVQLAPFLGNLRQWQVTREFGFLDPQYEGGWHKGTDFAHPVAGATEGAQLLSPWGAWATEPDVTAWRADRGWYGYWRLPRPERETDLAFFACHLQREPAPHGLLLGHVGDTGALTTGPHLHAGLCEEEKRPPYAVVRWIDLMGDEVERQW